MPQWRFQDKNPKVPEQEATQRSQVLFSSDFLTEHVSDQEAARPADALPHLEANVATRPALHTNVSPDLHTNVATDDGICS